MLSYLIFNSSVDRGIPSLAAGPFDPAILNRRNCSTCCVQETLYFCLSSPSPHGDLHASKRSFALSLFASGAFLAKTELAITILPLLVGRNRFDGVPVLCDFSVLYAEQIVKRRLLSAERALADNKHEIPVPKLLVDPVVLHRDSSSGHCLECRTKAGEIVGDLRIVLNVFIVVEVPRQLFHPAIHQDVIDEGAHQLLVRVGLIQISRFCRTIDHAVAAWVRTCRLLKIVPMLHDLAVLEAEDVEADLRTEEVVVGMREDVITIFEHTRCVHAPPSLQAGPMQRAQADKPVGGSKIVLNVLVWVYDR